MAQQKQENREPALTGLKLYILPEHGTDGNWHGSAYVRLLRPFTHPAVLGDKLEIIAFDHDYNGSHVDVVLVERGWRADLRPHIVENLINKVRRAGARLWWMIDDNLLDPHPQWSTEKNLLPLRPALEILAREADAILVSTLPLAQRLQRVNTHTQVLSNLLDERLLENPASRDSGQPLIIGYMGTFTHLRDLMSILPALRRVLHRHQGAVRLAIIGVTDIPHLAALLPKGSLDIQRPPTHIYPDFIRWITSSIRWDIGIAPLLSNPFNDCKSDIKLLDYGACALPSVYSSVPAYAESVEDGVTGLLATNTSEVWEEALERLIRDTEFRHAVGQATHHYLLNERTLAAKGRQWQSLLLELACTS